MRVDPFRLYQATVGSVQRLSPHMIRVTFTGLDGVRSNGPDQRIKIFLPNERTGSLDVPTGPEWYPEYQAMSLAERPPMRTYTLRAVRSGEIDIDFVAHGDTGPASRWVGKAAPGDVLKIFAPQVTGEHMGAEYRPADAAWQLIAGDETALPAIGAIVESLPAGTRALVFAEVPEDADRQDWVTAGDVDITWLPRNGTLPGHSSALVDAIRDTAFPEGAGYAWIAGESAVIRGLRRHLVTERGIDRKSIYFSGYWRLGRTEETAHEPVDED
ncbi:siderophore-interacting protein [Pseudonocardiaceae bacterium YIM PH 21723]|nr:siderophore-interacting protein [Pseudonocardiaceae bacterium YIM PH 21723]